MYPDETARACNFVFPQAHAVEAWGDFRAFDGTASIAQPLILPLYEQAKSEMEFVSALFGSPKPGYDIVRNYWKAQPSAGDFDKNWERWLNDGVIADSVYPPKTPVINAAGIPAQSPESGAFEVMYKIDPCVGDGSFANCGWMQELPKPISKLTWDNAAYISVATAQKLNLKSGDVVEITVGDSNVKAPVWVLPGHPDNSATVNFGYGRDHAGVVGDGIGFNAYDIWNSAAPSFALNASIKKTDASHRLVTTQTQWTMEGRDMVRMRPLDDWKKEEASTPTNGEAEEGKKEGKPASLYNLSQAEGWKSGFVQWGMVIDLTSCIGCNACAIACQAENNIPVVGKEQVANGRHMNWIRIDRYYATEAKNASNVDEPSTLFMPVPCMHCEKAPCEPVCPVGATVHSHEGLNQMVYNRCVGTRYCSNNCPYKVRRFNFLNFANDHSIPVKKLLTNPDVTVRGRGVMEKCTYCVQRISAERIRQKAAGLEFDGKGIVTACEQVCPTKAITFGNIDDASTEVFKKRKEKAHYSLLDELNTIPRTTYLERIFNPNPALSASHGKAEG